MRDGRKFSVSHFTLTREGASWFINDSVSVQFVGRQLEDNVVFRIVHVACVALSMHALVMRSKLYRMPPNAGKCRQHVMLCAAMRTRLSRSEARNWYLQNG